MATLADLEIMGDFIAEVTGLRLPGTPEEPGLEGERQAIFEAVKAALDATGHGEIFEAYYDARPDSSGVRAVAA